MSGHKELISAYMDSHGEAVSRLHRALQSISDQQNGMIPGLFIEVSFYRLCDVLGYKRQNGAHLTESLLTVKNDLKSIFRIEAIAVSRNRKGYKVRGPIWVQGILTSVWDDHLAPLTLRFAPSDWFDSTSLDTWGIDLTTLQNKEAK